MSSLRNPKVLLSLLLVFSWLIAGVGGYFLYSTNQSALAEKDEKMASLQNSINQVGELVTAYKVVADVKTGKKIEDTDITEIQVPVSMATNLITDRSKIVGKSYRLNLTSGTAISKELISDDKITDDMRLFDVVLHNMPVGLKVGSYIDIRISLPLGEDFIAIPHKKVYDIIGGTVKVAVNESDIHVYNSMLVDSLLYPSTQIYATEYLEGGVQTAADSYYPMSKNVLAVAQRDPNLLSAIKSDILKRRSHLDSSLSSVKKDKDSQESVDTVLKRGKEQYQQVFTEASREYQLRAERDAEKQKELEQQEAQAAAAQAQAEANSK